MEDFEYQPKLSLEAAIRLARDAFGIEAKASPLPSERDQNFLLTDQQNHAFVLKIANARVPRAVLELQTEAMDRLQASASGLMAPTTLPDREGHRITSYTTGDGHSHDVRLLTHVPGTPLAECRHRDASLLTSLGGAIGHLTRAFQDFQHPAARRSFKWDLAQAVPVIQERLPLLHSESRRRQIQIVLDRHQSEVAPFLDRLPQSIIHNDANDHNLIVQRHDAGQHQVSGIIDFGDMLLSRTIHELAIALAYAVLDQENPKSVADQVIAGYESVLPLQERERSLVLPLALLRLCCSVSIAAEQRRQAPDNEYLSVTEKPAWAVIDFFVQP